jgi:hypothetical protein
MRRWLIVLVLSVASATASAQSVPPATVTVKAQEVATTAERRVATLLAQRGVLTARYESELRAIDRLKQQKKTWNRDRDLKDKLSAANETAKSLTKADRELAAAQAQLVGSRRTLVTAIDTELATNPLPARADQLKKLRLGLVPQVKRSVHRIAIPNLEVDPGADPEDLDAQSAELRQIEAELQRQINSLDKQSKDLAQVAELRQSHDRANALDRREDGTPTRNPTRTQGGGRGDEALSDPAPTAGTDNGGGDKGESTAPPTEAPTALDEASTVLADVVDPSTIDVLNSAQRSGDPGKRSKAAAKTRDAVKARLAQLRQKRALIEQRAKQLRQ